MSEELKKKRAMAKRSFTRTRKNLQEALDKLMISKTVESRYQSFKEAWNESLRCHEEYVASLNFADEADEETEDIWINELEEVFKGIEEITDNYIETKKKAMLDKEKSDERKEKQQLEIDQLKIVLDQEEIIHSNNVKQIKDTVSKEYKQT